MTITGIESREKLHDLSVQLIQAKALFKINTWISFEPVIDEESVLESLRNGANAVDKVKIGKLNYHKSDINWHDFGIKAEKICKEQGINYYIKESLRAEMS